jgi:hypothetical protein
LPLMLRFGSVKMLLLGVATSRCPLVPDVPEPGFRELAKFAWTTATPCCFLKACP